MDVCESIHEFISEVIDMGWIMKTIKWNKTQEQIKNCTDELDEVAALMEFTVNINTHTIVSAFNEEKERVDKKVEEAGGVDKLIEDDEAMKQLIEQVSGPDKLQLAMTIKMMSRIGEIKQALAEMAERDDERSGPWKIVSHKKMCPIAKQIFGDKESIEWDTFFAVFPEQAIILDKAERNKIKAELEDDSEKTKLRLACDLDQNAFLHVNELAQAFPPDVPLAEKVRELKQCSKRPKGLHNGLEHIAIPRKLYGRDDLRKRLRQELEQTGGSRVVLLYGGQGEGKTTVAASVLKELWQDDKALGGLWLCQMSGDGGVVSTKADLDSRMLAALSTTVTEIDKEAGADASLNSRLVNFKEQQPFVVVDDVHLTRPMRSADGTDGYMLDDMLQTLLINMLAKVPGLKLVLLSRKKMDLKNLDMKLAEWGSKQVQAMDMGRMSDGDCVSMIRERFPDALAQVSGTICHGFGTPE